MTMDKPSKARLVVGPFNRVEGDLEVILDIADGQVAGARVRSTMYRGFEQILPGRPATDALVIVPRICGICSVSQSVAAARALEDIAGIGAPPNGAHVVNLMLGAENMADHLAHFYLFFMPDFTHEVYRDRPWHAAAHERFAALAGSHARLALAARQRWFNLLGILGGKWPHTQAILPGGSSRAVERSERIRLLARVREFRSFLEQTTFGAPLEEVAAIDSEAALSHWRAQHGRGDFRLFLDIADDLALDTLGPGPGLYMSNGAYLQPGGAHHFASGVWDATQPSPLSLDRSLITEDASHAFLASDGDALHPARGITLPDPDKAGAYTWNKAPRLDGRTLETGALARQLVAGHPLLRDIAARSGGNVRSRVVARLMELALVVPAMERWLQALDDDGAYAAALRLPDQGEGAGFVEAARGSLGHWVKLHRGQITHYQIVAPTSWNFSPRDRHGMPGPLEAALVGAPVRAGEASPISVQHIVRSFDPCMVCTVH